VCLRTRMRPYRSLAYTLPLLVLVSAGLEGQRRAGSPPLQTVPGTTLRVRLPAGWVVSRGRGPLDGLRYSAGPPYEIAAGQPNPNMQGESCIDMLGALMSLRQLQLRLAARPEFIPAAYGHVIAEGGQFQLACLPTGVGPFGVTITLRSGSPRPEVLTPLLTVLADAVLADTRPRTSGTQMRLPMLGIDLPLRDGAWGLQTVKDAAGTREVVQRAAAPPRHELVISFIAFPLPARCEAFMRSTGRSGQTTRQVNRLYGGPSWHADAIEQYPGERQALQVFLCRDGANGRILVSRIDYEASEIREDDRIVIRRMLEDAGHAWDRAAR
jgi:hypothetical protein